MFLFQFSFLIVEALCPFIIAKKLGNRIYMGEYLASVHLTQHVATLENVDTSSLTSNIEKAISLARSWKSR